MDDVLRSKQLFLFVKPEYDAGATGHGSCQEGRGGYPPNGSLGVGGLLFVTEDTYLVLVDVAQAAIGVWDGILGTAATAGCGLGAVALAGRVGIDEIIAKGVSRGGNGLGLGAVTSVVGTVEGHLTLAFTAGLLGRRALVPYVLDGRQRFRRGHTRRGLPCGRKRSLNRLLTRPHTPLPCP